MQPKRFAATKLPTEDIPVAGCSTVCECPVRGISNVYAQDRSQYSAVIACHTET